MRWRILTLVIVALISATSFAQSPLRSTHFDVPRPGLQPITQPPVSSGRMIVGGLLGGAVGFFGGGFAGALINDDGSGEALEALKGFAVGAVVGETIMLPLGVHIANRRQGNYGFSLLAASALTAVGLAFAASGEDHLEYLFPVPVLQLASSVFIEKSTTR